MLRCVVKNIFFFVTIYCYTQKSRIAGVEKIISSMFISLIGTYHVYYTPHTLFVHDR